MFLYYLQFKNKTNLSNQKIRKLDYEVQNVVRFRGPSPPDQGLCPWTPLGASPDLLQVRAPALTINRPKN
mgnify:CR=1 FL=1